MSEPSPPTAKIDYQALIEDALRGVVRSLLIEAAAGGLPGDHHFYLTFDTTHPGVVLAAPLRQRHPREMTIVLQHQFWNLEVDDEAFRVQLRFDGRMQQLSVPFRALCGFADPAAELALAFRNRAPAAAPDSGEAAASGEHVAARSSTDNLVSMEVFRRRRDPD